LLTAAVGIDAHGDDHGPRANLQGLAQPAVEIGSMHVDIGVAGLLQGPVKKGLLLLIDPPLM